jgi:NADH-quinone oxidoreductase subunit E
MLSEKIRTALRQRRTEAVQPRELAVEVLFALQREKGYLSDEALREGAEFLDLTPLELEEIATFYDFIYREPVGKFVLHACDGVVCWMLGGESVVAHLCRKLGVRVGEITADGLFTILPTACLGYCDHGPALLVNGAPYGPLTTETIDRLLERLKTGGEILVEDR